MAEKREVHSSALPDVTVKNYAHGSCKYYYIPLYKDVFVSAQTEHHLGASNPRDRTLTELSSCFVKATKGVFSHVKIPVERCGGELIEAVLEMSKDSSLGVVFQCFTSLLHDSSYREFIDRHREIVSFEWIIDTWSESLEQHLISFQLSDSTDHLSVLVERDLRWSGLLQSVLMRSFSQLHLYFGYPERYGSKMLDCNECHRLVGVLRKRFPELQFLPPKGTDLWDHRATESFDMEPFLRPCFTTQSSQPDIRFSVIIPTYNNQNHLRVVIEHLTFQDVGADAFEVIVVDDGSSDQTQELVIERLRQLPRAINFKYIYFPRKKKRVMGDSQYRAGIARNLGAKNAVGDMLAFLDSDIVVPTNYLNKVEEGLSHWDALQAKRIHLSRDASHLNFKYAGLDKERDIIPDDPYWEAFLQTKDWHLLPYNWKYVCTHSFSVRRDTFWDVGGLKRNFIFYGFEDTDLGYRLVKSGYRLHLLDCEVLHMFHEDVRSEFMNLKSVRHTLLSRTAQIFYLHHFDEDIYENLLIFMEPEPTFRRLMGRVLKTLSLQFLWRPKDQVFRSLGRAGKKSTVPSLSRTIS